MCIRNFKPLRAVSQKKIAFGFHILLYIGRTYISGQTNKVLVNISKENVF